MDRTVTRRATYTPFLLHCALRRAPWRLLSPAARRRVDARLCREADRPGEAEGDQPPSAARRKIHPRDLKPLVESFADKQIATNIRPGARRGDRARQGAKGGALVMATASYRLYADAIAERLGFDDVIGTGSIIGLDERVHAKIDGENCYGPAKLRMIADWVEASGVEGHARPCAFLLRPCVGPAGVRMGRRAGRGESARQAAAAGRAARLGDRGLG